MVVSPRVLLVHHTSESQVVIASVCRELQVGVKLYVSAASILEEKLFPPVGCAVFELPRGARHGLRVQDTALRYGSFLPLIYIAAQTELDAAVDATRKGAFAVVENPIDRSRLSEAIRAALEFSERGRSDALRRSELRYRLALLTPREQEILALLALGKTSKAIAEEIHRSMKTVEQHRAHILRKLGARNSMELIRDMALIQVANERRR